MAFEEDTECSCSTIVSDPDIYIVNVGLKNRVVEKALDFGITEILRVCRFAAYIDEDSCWCIKAGRVNTASKGCVHHALR